ncbi:MAG: sugar phosphate isomerase/epimerase family protein [Phycisphaerae bacterium]
MKLSAMTLGCPTWDLDTILHNVKSYGFDGIDFRGLQSDLDITQTTAFTTNLVATARKIADSGLLVSGISSSITACDPTKRVSNIEEAKRTIPIALALGTENIRIFGGGPVDTIGQQEAAVIGRDCINDILALPGASQLQWLFETHDHWVRAENCKLLLDAISLPNFGVLWDLGHTYRIGKETPDQTWAAINNRILYADVKDASFHKTHPQAMSDGWRYVLPGTGQLPLAQSIKLLKSHGYQGWLLCEHEKRWHTSLPEPELIFPYFIKWIRPLIA